MVGGEWILCDDGGWVFNWVFLLSWNYWYFCGGLGLVNLGWVFWWWDWIDLRVWIGDVMELWLVVNCRIDCDVGWY